MGGGTTDMSSWHQVRILEEVAQMSGKGGFETFNGRVRYNSIRNRVSQGNTSDPKELPLESTYYIV